MGHQALNAQQNQIGNQTMVGNRSTMLNPQHATSRTSEMSLMLAENLAESVLNHQNNTNNQVSNVAVKHSELVEYYQYYVQIVQIVPVLLHSLCIRYWF